MVSAVTDLAREPGTPGGRTSGAAIAGGAAVNELASDPAQLSADVAVLPVAEVAQMLGVPVSRVHQMVRDGQLLSVRRDGAVWVPSDFFADGAAASRVCPGRSCCCATGATATRRSSGGSSPTTPRLPGSPIASLRAGRHREVKRRAQAMAF